MPFETINETLCVSKNLFQGEGSFSKHADELVKSIILKDPSTIRYLNGLATVGERIKYLRKHVPNFDFASKVTCADAFIERDIKKVI